MAREGMANLILEARRLANAGTADTTTAGTVFWSDDQIQAILDRHQTIWKTQLLEPSGTVGTGGTVTYTEYLFPGHINHVEEAGSASGWAIKDGTGGTAPSYTANYQAGLITFDADTSGSAYYLDCRAYDMNRAVAEIWDQKAGFAATNVDWSSDNHRVAASQEAQAYRDQARMFNAAAGVEFTAWQREDEL
jgi:hypothetical protein